MLQPLTVRPSSKISSPAPKPGTLRKRRGYFFGHRVQLTEVASQKGSETWSTYDDSPFNSRPTAPVISDCVDPLLLFLVFDLPWNSLAWIPM